MPRGIGEKKVAKKNKAFDQSKYALWIDPQQAKPYEPKYCDVILTRWENFTGQKAVLLNGE